MIRKRRTKVVDVERLDWIGLIYSHGLFTCLFPRIPRVYLSRYEELETGEREPAETKYFFITEDKLICYLVLSVWLNAFCHALPGHSISRMDSPRYSAWEFRS